MAYIGNTPAENYVSIAAQHFTVSATTSYSLNRSVTNENELALFINNVRQQPGSSYSYTATGTTLTLSAATAATDTMYCVFLGKSVGTIAPPEGSVGTATLATGAVTADKIADGTVVAAEIADGAVTDAKISAVATSKLTGTVTNAQIADLDAAKLTGTVADARFPATLPASSGANLTGLTAGNITGVIPAANLGTGTANATTFLNGSGAYSEAGGGALTYISTVTASSSTSLNIALTSTYDSYVFSFINVVPATDSAIFWMRLSNDSGSTFESTGYKHGSVYAQGNAAPVENVQDAGGNDAEWQLTGAVDSTVGINGECRIFDHSSSGLTFLTHQIVHDSAFAGLGGMYGHGGCIYITSEVVNGIQFLFSTGNVASGKIHVYGIKNS